MSSTNIKTNIKKISYFDIFTNTFLAKRIENLWTPFFWFEKWCLLEAYRNLFWGILNRKNLSGWKEPSHSTPSLYFSWCTYIKLYVKIYSSIFYTWSKYLNWLMKWIT